RNADQAYNLGRMRELAAEAAAQGAEVVSFHECCIPAYTFVQKLSREEILAIAEPVPGGPSIAELHSISRDTGAAILAGLLEREGDRLYNTYVCVDGDRLVAKFRKLHAFISPHIDSGSEYCVFELRGWQCGILICYDNNLVENVRATTLLGAELIFMPHVTGCLPSVMPGRGLVDPQLWERREDDPVPLRLELNGPKGRGWLMRWLPARAYDNGVYAVFTNPVGLDNGEVRNGNSMVLDPYGEIIGECTRPQDDFVVALCTRSKLETASGRRYIRARRPDLYGVLVEPSTQPPVTAPGWELAHQAAK
ncbi:MAG: nitrilase, partial [Planctomycetaceae bacterium]|nr:nitrilase [Planctomycetaceae bacterium]